MKSGFTASVKFFRAYKFHFIPSIFQVRAVMDKWETEEDVLEGTDISGGETGTKADECVERRPESGLDRTLFCTDGDTDAPTETVGLSEDTSLTGDWS